ncbi:MAG: YqeG family HAD IIIA-type phosphatase [Oscillospiraceae bacterium]|nr:YqeG family HAD IIIA-type phosphatase [Oscillospiraceae bacterium]
MRLLPDFYFKNVCDISAGFLQSEGVRALLLDIDNTLAFDCRPELPESTSRWLEDMRSAGIKLLIVSNNKEERTASFAEKCALPYIASAFKPSARAFLQAQGLLGCSAEDCAVVGDQLFTDMAFARRAGCKAVFVEPMGEDLQGFVRFKRLLERPFMKAVRAREVIK